MKLELKHLAPYLPYGLKILEITKGNFECDPRNENKELLTDRNISRFIGKKPYKCLSQKPILRPLSDLTKVNGFSLSDMISYGYHNPFWLPENFEVKYLMHLDFEKLVSWHFDVLRLIPAGLAIDINTLKN
jgi:hypothetical protein